MIEVNMNELHSTIRGEGMVDKKQKIIEATIEQFAAKGVENTKISDIVKAAGIAQGTFYYIFRQNFLLCQKSLNMLLKRL